MKYKRVINLLKLLDKKSILLLGPRQTGKSTLTLDIPEAQRFDLAESDIFRELSARPELLRQRLLPGTKVVVIDEAQRIPEIFNEAQVLIDRNPELRLVLTGSSARKLRRSKVNLLPGRVWRKELFPLTTPELGSARLEERAIRGSLPAIIDNPDFRRELDSYAGLYLDEEVRAEGLTREIGVFSRFLPLAALSNAEQVNFTKIANDVGASPNTIRGYYEILEDTLLGALLPVFRKTVIRKAVATPKFYLFDTGVANAILKRFDVSPESELFGKALEHLIWLELRAYLSYRDRGYELAYWRSQSKLEVDFVVNGSVAIEVKASRNIHPRDVRGLRALAEELPLQRKIVVCRESTLRRTDDGVEIMPAETFLSELWDDRILS